MISTNHLQKHYDKFSLDCTLDVRPGYVTGLIGRNGSGKTTTFKALLGLITPDGGSATMLGKPVSALTPDDRQKIGVVLSGAGPFGELTVNDIAKILAATYTHFDKATFFERVHTYELPLKKKTKTFSTGMQAKLKLLIATTHAAQLLILDEPTAGLDPLARDDILDDLRAFMAEDDNRAILISSHISSDLETLCDDLYMIDGGRVIFHEDTDVILDDYAVLKLTPAQYEAIDRHHLLRIKRASYGYDCLTNACRYYRENYPDMVVEDADIDSVFSLMIRGDQQ